MTRIVVVGGGIAGLSTAWHLREASPKDLDLDVLVLESSPHAGGRVRSFREDGFLFEWGPHGFLDTAPDTLDMIERLGITSSLLESRDEARHRHVLYGGKLREVPQSPLAFLSTPLLPFGGKLRLLAEPFIRRKKVFDESVSQFAARRLGPSVIPGLLEPFVTGVYGGDVRQLSVSSAFPRLFELERQHGGIFRGMMANRRAKKAQGEVVRSPRLCSFKEGMGELSGALAKSMGSDYRDDIRVTSIQRDMDGYALEVEGRSEATLRADVLVLAVPSGVARELLGAVDEDLGATLGTLPTAGVAVVCLTMDRSQVQDPLRSFGFLCARSEGRRLLGCIYASSVFDGHAPEGKVSLRAMLGGVHDPGILSEDDGRIVSIALKELGPLLGLKGDPEIVRVFKHPEALPQYNLGHQARLASIDGQLRHHPNLYLTGASYRGVSVNDCIRNGRKTATHVVRQLLTG